MYDNRKRGYVWVDKHAPPTTFSKPNLHPQKVLLSVWWCCNGVIHYNFLQPGQTITAESYCRDLDLMHQKLQTFWPAVVNRKGPILLQDNARPHTSKTTRQKLTQLNIEVLPHPAYSPDLSLPITTFSGLSMHSCARRCSPIRTRPKMPSGSLSTLVTKIFGVME